MIRHPQYAVWWWHAHEGVARMAEEGEYPDSVKGLMKMFAGPFGMAFYANPAALFMVTQLLPTTAPKEDPQNVTGLGHYLLKIKNEWGLGPIPAIDAALNLMGVYGDNFMPDMLPSRTGDLVLAGLDAAAGDGRSSRAHPGLGSSDGERARLLLRDGAVDEQRPRRRCQRVHPRSDRFDGAPTKPRLVERMTCQGADGRPTDDALAAQRSTTRSWTTKAPARL
jgi:hypothetical protein